MPVTQHFEQDAGQNFGRWTDDVSRLMYHDIMPEILKDLDLAKYRQVGDLGGGNGLLKEFMPNSVSIDIDPTKNPDIVDDIRTCRIDYGFVILRYVLHYLSDIEVKSLIARIPCPALIIQFANEGNHLETKRQISRQYETKTVFHRDLHSFRSLFGTKTIMNTKRFDYTVTPEFYNNRLQVEIDNSLTHNETVHSFLIQ
jgi:hypothetical protein